MEFLVDVMDRKQKRRFALFILLWLSALLSFWSWWLHASHLVSWPRMLVNSVALYWLTLMPAWFLSFMARMKRPNPNLPVPDGLRVAMVVTKAPSEPFALVKDTLLDMLNQRYPHDTWLADEDPSPETTAWCKRHGVGVSSRKWASAYHRASWPRRTRCKEGNLAYFYDRHGYDRYDVVVQLDADHRPGRGYLEEMLRPFADPAVGYVSAPSICDANRGASWAARGRLYAEAGLHGFLQAGYANGWAPLCIGSHYAVRTAALKEIGGLGPELAEDHTTTLMMNAHGWKGVHALDADARGFGPSTFADCMRQEFQWARSLTQILLTVTPRYFRRLPSRLKFQFVYAEMWYPLLALTMSTAYLLPLVALAVDTPWMKVSYPEFLLLAAWLTGCVMAIMIWAKRQGWLRPKDSAVISWESVLFQLVRWPWAAVGVLAGVAGAVQNKSFEFRVTPKTGGVAHGPLPNHVLLPYLVLCAVSGSLALWVSGASAAKGYYFFAIVNALLYGLAALATVVRHGYENGWAGARKASGPWRKQVALVVACLAVPVVATYARGLQAVEGITWGYHERVAFLLPTGASCREGGSAAAWHPENRCTTAGRGPDPVVLGVYDPSKRFDEATHIGIEHFFIDWVSYRTAELLLRLEDARQRGRTPMVTVEPWPVDPGRLGGPEFFAQVMRGGYDDVIHRLCKVLGGHGGPVLIRWGHEMEHHTGRYPWARDDPSGYVGAYRHFVQTCRMSAAQATYVWSPAGNAELEAFWPGGNHVDLVGLSVFHFPDWERDAYGRVRTFEEAFSQKYQRAVGFHRPILIAELGILGAPAEQEAWLRGMFESLPRYTQLSAIVYFNGPDRPGAWAGDYGTPDWHVPPQLFRFPRELDGVRGR